MLSIRTSFFCLLCYTSTGTLMTLFYTPVLVTFYTYLDDFVFDHTVQPLSECLHCRLFTQNFFEFSQNWKQTGSLFSYWIIYKYCVNYNYYNMVHNYIFIAIVDIHTAIENWNTVCTYMYTHTQHWAPDLTPHHHWCCGAHACLYCSDQCCPHQLSSGSPSGRHTTRGGPSVGDRKRKHIEKTNYKATIKQNKTKKNKISELFFRHFWNWFMI